MTDSIALIRTLVALPGPPGEEKAVREWLAERLRGLGYTSEVDAKGNLLTRLPAPPGVIDPPTVVVTAHLDEIALMVTRIEEGGKIRVAPMGGLFTWKWGEGPVELLTRDGIVQGILSYGSIHTNNEASVAEFARKNPLDWEKTYVFTGLDNKQLRQVGVRPGVRVVLDRKRRQVTEFGEYVASYFLDDRADLAVWLLALEAIQESGWDRTANLLFAATTSEEVGGEGAQYLLRTQPAEICVALEIGPKTPDADFPIDSQPTIWVRDGYAAMEPIDGDLLTDCAADLGMEPHWQYLSRGGSDASCSASRGFTARPVTLGIPTENSHGYEIMHRDAPAELVRLLIAYLRRVAGAEV